MKGTTTALAVTMLFTSALPLVALADPGLYVGGSVGNARLDDKFDNFIIDTDTNAYRCLEKPASSFGMPTLPSTDFRSTQPAMTIPTTVVD